MLTAMNELILAGCAFVGGAAGAVVAGTAKEYFAARGKKAGELDEIAAQLPEVLRQLREATRAVESIKADYWVSQERWKLKRDAYIGILESLERTAIAARAARIRLTPSERQAALLSALEVDNTAGLDDVFRRHRIIARLLLSADASAALSDLTVKAWALVDAEPDEFVNMIEKLHREAFYAVVEIAKTDLGMDKPPGS